MSANNSNNQENNNVPMNVELHGAGKTKIVSLEQLRKPHSVTASPEFMKNHLIRDTQPNNNNTAGGLLQTGNHRPSSQGNK